MKAAFYECDITPPLGGFMWGHYKEIRAKEVHKRLYAKAVVLDDGKTTSAIVVVDTCILPEEMHDIVTKRVFEYTGISAENICISSNHAHTGAPVSDGPEVGCYADAAYKDVFFRLCADAIILAYNRLFEVEIKFAEPVIDGISYCRNYELLDGTLVTHGAGRDDKKRMLSEPDRSYPILMFYKDGKPIGAISSFACHQCTTGNVFSTPGYVGDYASYLSDYLKKAYGHEFVSLFLIGASGDINTSNPDKTAFYYRCYSIGEHLAKVVVENEANLSPVSDGVKVIKESVRIDRRMVNDPAEAANVTGKALIGAKHSMRGRNMMYYLATNKKEYSDLYVQGILIGDVYLAMLPGEIYNDIAKDIKKRSPYKRTIVIENCKSYCGYIPTKECFVPNSNLYETSLCYHSCHVPEAADIIADKAIEISNKLNKN